MINVTNWEVKKARYEAYWNRTNKTPILNISSPKDNAQYDESLSNVDSDTFWFDPQWLIKAIRDGFKNTYFGGDSYPYVSPSIGPELVSGILGLELVYNEASVWTKHLDCGLENITDFELDKDNWYFKKAEEILIALAEDAKQGDYIVGMIDMNTIIDGVSSMIGPENLCYEMIDSPEEVKRVCKEHFELYKQIFTHYSDIVTKYQGGNTHWLAVYSDIPSYFISADFICMVSPDSFDEFIKEPISEMAQFHPRVIFHLDGENAVLHLDKILEIEEITAVQVQGVATTHCASFWIPYIQKIQEANKCVIIQVGSDDELKLLLETCKPEGLFVSMYKSTEDQVRATEKLMADFYEK